MLNQAIGGLLPAAAAVALSPIPIIAIVLVLDSARARVSGPAFAAGWVAGLSAVSVVVVRLVGATADDSSVDTGINWIMVGIGVAFLVMAGRDRKSVV